MAGPDFKLEIDCGAGAPIPFTLSEESLSTHRDPRIRTAAMADGGSRPALRMAALLVAEATLSKRPEQPISVADGDSIWVIPTQAVRSIRLRDPEAAPETQPFGFAMNRPEIASSLLHALE